MNGKNSLLEAMKQVEYPLSAHGKRTFGVLQEALAEADGQTESDVYGKGEAIEAFQRRMAAYLGKEEAVFFPSGTMAQQIAMRIWCDRRELPKVAYHPLCHLEIHEQDGLRKLHRIEPILLAEADRLITLEDVTGLGEEVACILLELPQREIGGQLPDYATLEAISAHCRSRGIRLHLDGARLFEVLPYYGRTAAEVCSLFDSVYVSFYKGIGGIAGAILAGEPDFIQEAIVWKRRHGGDLISLYPYVWSAEVAFDRRIGKMGQYYEEAKELAARFNGCHSAVSTLPRVPVSNMFHVHIACSKEELEPLLVHVYEASGVGFAGRLKETGEASCSFEVSVGDAYGRIPKDTLEKALHLLEEALDGRAV